MTLARDGLGLLDLLGESIVTMLDIGMQPNPPNSYVPRIAQRELAIARNSDTVLLIEEPDQAYISWLQSIGRGFFTAHVIQGEQETTLPERILKAEGLDELLNTVPGHSVLLPFYGNSMAAKASERLNVPMYSNPKLIDELNSKINFKNLCQELGIQTVPFSVYEAGHGTELLVSQVKAAQRETGTAIVRGDYGASGSTTYVINTPDDDKLSVIANSDSPAKYLIEPFMQVVSSPTSNMFVSRDGAVRSLGQTEQILTKDLKYNGNSIFPSDVNWDKGAEVIGTRVGEHLSAQGFIGPFGIDYIRADDGLLYAAELNPRISGSMFPLQLLSSMQEQIPTSYALYKNVFFNSVENFVSIEHALGDLLFDGSPHASIFPIGPGSIPHGRLTLLVLGNPQNKIDEVFNEAESRLHRLGGY